MAVQILILSGARQGEQLTLGVEEFRVGPEPGCEVFFDPGRDSAAKDRSALFSLRQDGWYVTCTGGEIFVNQQPVVGSTRLRSGDVVRMSEVGPDFAFSIVTRAAGTQAGTRWEAPAAPLAPAVAKPCASLEPLPSPAAVLVPLDLPSAPVEPRAPALAPVAAGGPWRLPMWAGGGLAVGVLFCIAGWLLMASSGRSVADRSDQKITQPDTASQQPGKTPQVPDATTKDPWEQLREAVLLLAVEQSTGKSVSTWPFATCCAISEDTLLTSAAVASELAKFHGQADKGFKVYAQSPSGLKREVQSIRIHPGYAELAEEPEKRRHFDLALLTIQGKLPKTAQLASPQELAGLAIGFPVACFGFTHEGQMLSASENVKPEKVRGKVFIITELPDVPGSPRLLFVKAAVPPNYFGSPLFNEEGKIVGVYSEPVPAQDAQGVKDLHYATVVNEVLINTWMRADHPSNTGTDQNWLQREKKSEPSDHGRELPDAEGKRSARTTLEGENVPRPPPAAPWKQLQGAVLLLVVQKSTGNSVATWPFATCCAVSAVISSWLRSVDTKGRIRVNAPTLPSKADGAR